MNPSVQKYPFDPDLNERGNYIVNEPFDLSNQINKKNKCLTFKGGYFFTDTVSIMDGNGYVLVPDIDYQATHLNKEAVELTGKSICGMLVIINPNINGIVFLTGHLLGGDYVSLNPIIKESIDTLEKLQFAPPNWNDIVGKPDDFKPNGHFMLWGQMYGFTPFTLAVNELIETVRDINLDILEHELIDFTFREISLLRNIALLEEQLQSHTRPGFSSHTVSSTTIGIPNVDNVGIITSEEIKQLDKEIPLRYVDAIKHNEIMDYWLRVNLNHQHNIPFSSMNTYTASELNNKIDSLVSKNQPASLTLRIDNKSFNGIIDGLPSNYSVAEFKVGMFPIDKIALNSPVPGSVLANDKRFHSFTSLLDLNYPGNQNCLVMGKYDSVDDAINVLNLTYTDGSKSNAIFTLTKRFENETNNEDYIDFPVLVSFGVDGWKLKGI